MILMNAKKNPFKTGMIILWSGSVATIPGGWVLCDGSNGTPDLLDRFVIAAGDNFDPDDSGGALTHSHAFTGDGHVHNLLEGPWIPVGLAHHITTDSAAETGTTDTGNNIPPYYALCYIMKL